MNCQSGTLLIHILSGSPPCEKPAVYNAVGPLQPGVALCEEHAYKIKQTSNLTLKPLGATS